MVEQVEENILLKGKLRAQNETKKR